MWGGDHDGAVAHVRKAEPKAAPPLNRLLGIKSRAEYDPETPGRARVETAVKAAERLVEMAGQVVHRE